MRFRLEALHESCNDCQYSIFYCNPFRYGFKLIPCQAAKLFPEAGKYMYMYITYEYIKVRYGPKALEGNYFQQGVSMHVCFGLLTVVATGVWSSSSLLGMSR